MKCTHKPETNKNSGLGMYHCPECGQMVLAGVPHPDYAGLENDLELKDLCESCDKIVNNKECRQGCEMFHCDGEITECPFEMD